MPAAVGLPMKHRNVTTARRTVQVVFFALILYGGFVFPHGYEATLMPGIEAGTPRTTMYSRDRILWVSGKESVIDLYLPVLACRFIAQGGFFKSCSVHVLSENLTWKTSLKLLLPHVTWLAILSFILARSWCGWACPLGATQDALSWVRRKLSIAPWHVTDGLRRFIGNLRHVLLWLSLAISILIALPLLGAQGVNDALFLVYCQICPGRIAYPLLGGVNPCWTDWSNSITTFMTFLGWAFLGVFALSFTTPRLWCRICAVGALLSYFNRGGLLALEKRPGKCTFCGTCRRVCPVDVERVYKERAPSVVTDTQCTLCLRCLETCPEKGCLSAKLAGVKLTES